MILILCKYFPKDRDFIPKGWVILSNIGEFGDICKIFEKMSDSSQLILSLILHSSQWDLFSLFLWSIRADSSSAGTKISLVMISPKRSNFGPICTQFAFDCSRSWNLFATPLIISLPWESGVTSIGFVWFFFVCMYKSIT